MQSNHLEESLKEKNLSLTDFRNIASRLFAYGIVVRSEGGIEQRIYDEARRVEDLLVDYFSISGFRLVHDLRSEFFRLYPPGAQAPGLEDDNLEPVTALRAKLSADVVAASLTLRFLYQQGLQDGGGRLTDAGEVMIRFEDLAAAMLTQLRRKLPESVVERRQILTDLRRHRLLSFASNFDINDEEAFMAIRPTILGIISEEAVANALEGAGIDEVIDEQTDAEVEECAQ